MWQTLVLMITWDLWAFLRILRFDNFRGCFVRENLGRISIWLIQIGLGVEKAGNLLTSLIRLLRAQFFSFCEKVDFFWHITLHGFLLIKPLTFVMFHSFDQWRLNFYLFSQLFQESFQIFDISYVLIEVFSEFFNFFFPFLFV